MIHLEDIHSLSEFQRHTKDFVARMKQTRRPVVLTVNGQAELVVQDAASYQTMLDRLQEAESIAAIQQGITDFAEGRSEDASTAFDSLRRKHGVPG
jgi:prevent-host-death family protein